MPKYYDMSLEELKNYRPELTRQPDFTEFWENNLRLSNSQPLNAQLKHFKYPVKGVSVYDVYYDGFENGRIHGYYILPENGEKLPALIHFHGYGGNRKYINEYLKWVLQGYAVFTIDVRGQGGQSIDGSVYDQGSTMGWLTKGIRDKNIYYYKYVYMDCKRAVDFLSSRDEIDKDRIGVYGKSQGGALAMITAALDKRIKLCMPNYPFLCNFQRAVQMFDQGPYGEIFEYFRLFDCSNEKQQMVYGTLSYFDVMNFSDMIECPVLMAGGLVDLICPPSTFFAAYNHLKCKKTFKLYPNFEHEELWEHEEERIKFANRLFSMGSENI